MSHGNCDRTQSIISHKRTNDLPTVKFTASSFE